MFGVPLERGLRPVGDTTGAGFNARLSVHPSTPDTKYTVPPTADDSPPPELHAGAKTTDATAATSPNTHRRVAMETRMPHSVLMHTGTRLTLAGVVVAMGAFVAGTTVIPTHVTLGAGSIRCGTVLHPDRQLEVAPICGPTGANHLQAVVVLTAIRTVIAVVPMLLERRRLGRPVLWASWAIVMAVATVAGLAVLGWAVEYAPESAFFDL